MTDRPTVWLLHDDRAGHTAHSRAAAQLLGVHPDEKTLHYNGLARLPNALLGASIRHLDAASCALIAPPWPDEVIATGRRLVPVMRYIKQQSPNTRLTQCLWPGRLEPFDRIIMPTHDNPPDDPRIVPITGALHGLTKEMLVQAAKQFAWVCDGLPAPYVAVFIGGHSRHGKMAMHEVAGLLDRAELLAKGGSLLISTSRRTPKGAVAMMKDRVTSPYYLYDWREGGDNPYLGLLALADALVVTGDSISMLSEAASTHKPLLVHPVGSMAAKHHRCMDDFIDQGMAQRLSADVTIYK